MSLPPQLFEQLTGLALGLAEGGEGLVDGLSTLVSTLVEAVSGYTGLQLTVVHTGQPVRLTAMAEADHPARSSLRLPLPLVSPAFEEGSSFVVWSTVPGSLVDLSADLAYVFRSSVAVPTHDAQRVRVDVDLPPPTTVSGLDGLDELATIHQAAGLLIAQGQDPDLVHETLRGGASAAGLSTHAWAARLLRRR